MTVRLDNSVFIHIPRTGGMWLREVLRKLGLDRQIFHGDLDSHLAYSQLPEEWYGKLTPFSFIRHPLKWVKSRWTHAMEINAHGHGRHFGIHRRFDNCVRLSFKETLECIVKNEPGLVTRTFNFMASGVPKENLACTVDLPDAAFDLLHRLEGLPDDQLEAVRQVEKTNSTSQHECWLQELEDVPADLVNEFLETEIGAVELWQSRRKQP